MLRVVCTTTSHCLPAPPGPGNSCPEEGTSLLPREQAGAPEAAPPWHGVGSSRSIVLPISGTHVAPGPVPSRSERLHGEPGGLLLQLAPQALGGMEGEVFALAFWLCLHTNTFALGPGIERRGAGCCQVI